MRQLRRSYRVSRKSSHIVIEEDNLAANKAVLSAYFSANPQKTLLADSLLGNFYVPEYVSHLAFSNTLHNLNTFRTYDSQGANTNLMTVDLSALTNLDTFGWGFFSGYRNLTTLYLPPLSNVTTVENFFLYNCRNLVTVDLSTLSNVRTIAHWFLGNCINLTAVDLSPLANITAVGHIPLSGYQGTAPIDPHGVILMQAPI